MDHPTRFLPIVLGFLELCGISNRLLGAINIAAGVANVAPNTRRKLKSFANLATEQLAEVAHSEYVGLTKDDREAVEERLSYLLTGGDQGTLLGAALLGEADFWVALKSDPTALAGLERGGRTYFEAMARATQRLVVKFAQSPDMIGIASTAALRAMQNEMELRPTSIEIESIIRESVVRELEERTKDPGFDMQDFEEKYVAQVAARFSVIEIFGLPVAREHRILPLSVAYLSLNASRTSEYSHAHDPSTPTSSPLEGVLSESTRLMLRGEAGSGKTTALHWIAATTATKSHALPTTKFLNDMVPFFVPLRSHTDELPSTDQLAKVSVPAFARDAPKGWIDSILSAGRGILLVDGIDELSIEKRPGILGWLEAILSSYPRVRVIVSSRPADGLDEFEQFFSTFDLTPMTTRNIERFANHWHQAATAVAPAEAEANKQFAQSFKMSINMQPALRQLASSPLLCGMMCALNRDRRATLPKGRIELYRHAIEMLLWRREVERGIAGNVVGLELEQRLFLLQKIAQWMTVNAVVDAPIPTIVALIKRNLPYFPSSLGAAEDVYRDLIERSGLLRELPPGRVDFIHRTFQEYLAAESLLNDDSLDAIASNAHLDSYRELTVLAVGIASLNKRNTLVRGILERAAASPDKAQALKTTALACLETTETLDPALRTRLEATLGTIVPPTSVQHARSLVRAAGANAVPLLRGHSLRGQNVVAACVKALGMIATPEALQALVEYGLDSRRPVVEALLEAWESFDPNEFATQVMLPNGLVDGIIATGSLDVAKAACEHLPQVRGLHLSYTGELASLMGGGIERLLTRLRLTPKRSKAFEWDQLTGFAVLNELTLEGFPFFYGSVELGNLATLRVGDFYGRDLATFATIPSLRGLHLYRWPQFETLEGFDLSAVTELELTRVLKSNFILPSMPKLETLRIGGNSRGEEGLSIGTSSSLPHLTTVILRRMAISSLDLPGIKELRLSEATVESGLDRMTSLRVFQVDSAPWFSVAELPNTLQEVRIADVPDIIHPESLLHLHQLQKLSLSLDGASRDLISAVAALPNHVELDMSRKDKGKIAALRGQQSTR